MMVRSLIAERFLQIFGTWLISWEIRYVTDKKMLIQTIYYHQYVSILTNHYLIFDNKNFIILCSFNGFNEKGLIYCPDKRKQLFWKNEYFFYIFFVNIRTDSPSTVWCLRGVMVKAMNCWVVVSGFELQSRYYVHFRTNTLGKDMNPLIRPSMG